MSTVWHLRQHNVNKMASQATEYQQNGISGNRISTKWHLRQQDVNKMAYQATECQQNAISGNRMSTKWHLWQPNVISDNRISVLFKEKVAGSTLKIEGSTSGAKPERGVSALLVGGVWGLPPRKF